MVFHDRHEIALEQSSASKPLPLPSTLEDEASNHSRRHHKSTNDRRAHQSLLRNLVVNQPLQAPRLEIPRLVLQEQVVVPSRLGIAAQFVVSQRQVVKTLPPALRGAAEDFRQ